MNGIELILIALVMFVAAYKLYGGFLTKRLEVNNNKETPAHTMSDGVDYCPAKAPVLLGHHFASIAGAGPIVGSCNSGRFWMDSGLSYGLCLDPFSLVVFMIMQVLLHQFVIKVNRLDSSFKHTSV